jgi:peptidyl-prolyl cis-trans isomerase C
MSTANEITQGPEGVTVSGCAEGDCGCHAAAYDAGAGRTLPRVNGVAIQAANDDLTPEHWRQRVFTELLRQTAQREGLLAQDDQGSDDGIISERAAQAIDTLVAGKVKFIEPDQASCERHYHHHLPLWTIGEKVRLRHILFAVTEGVDVNLLRQRAEQVLIELRSQDPADTHHFSDVAKDLSNCPSGAEGGHLGWLGREDCAPEFANAVFGQSQVGVLAKLVHSRFGFHVVEVLERQPGTVQSFETVQAAVKQRLQQQAYATAVHQYLMTLVDDALLEGIDLTELSPAQG